MTARTPRYGLSLPNRGVLFGATRQRSKAEVAEYWLTHDSAAEVDWAAPGVRLEFDPEVERPTQPVTVVYRAGFCKNSECWRRIATSPTNPS